MFASSLTSFGTPTIFHPSHGRLIIKNPVDHERFEGEKKPSKTERFQDLIEKIFSIKEQFDPEQEPDQKENQPKSSCKRKASSPPHPSRRNKK
jgi:hypothetical protein